MPNIILSLVIACTTGTVEVDPLSRPHRVQETGSMDTGSMDTGSVDTGPIVVDADKDGYSEEEDCDDTNPGINPGMQESPYNGADDDCDPTTLDDDLDGDGYPWADDCDDMDSGAHPDGIETCYDSVDNDCDGQVDNIIDDNGFNACEFMVCDKGEVDWEYKRGIDYLLNYYTYDFSNSSRQDEMAYRGCGQIYEAYCHETSGYTAVGDLSFKFPDEAINDLVTWRHAPLDFSSITFKSDYTSFWCPITVAANVDGQVVFNGEVLTVTIYK